MLTTGTNWQQHVHVGHALVNLHHCLTRDLNIQENFAPLYAPYQTLTVSCKIYLTLMNKAVFILSVFCRKDCPLMFIHIYSIYMGNFTIFPNPKTLFSTLATNLIYPKHPEYILLIQCQKSHCVTGFISKQVYCLNDLPFFKRNMAYNGSHFKL